VADQPSFTRAKPAFDARDQSKLDRAFGNPVIRQRIASKAADLVAQKTGRCDPAGLELVKSLAYATGEVVPEDYVVFVVESPRRVSVRCGGACTDPAGRLSTL